MTVAATLQQRRRWEHGHLATIVRTIPGLLVHSFRRPTLLGLALHLGVPPLAFLALAGATGLVVLALCHAVTPAIVLGGAIMGAFASIVLTWARFARAQLPARDLLLLPVYILRKIPLYLGFFIKRQRAWIRTERPDPPAQS